MNDDSRWAGFNTDLDLNWNDYGAKWYDPSIARWNAVDPLAEEYYSMSSYNYVANNPFIFIDPDGSFIDFYNVAGEYLGNYGQKNDKRVFLVQEGISIDDAIQTVVITDEIGIGTIGGDAIVELDVSQEEVEQFAANVFNEHDSSQSEREKIASAMQNRTEDHDGSYKEMTDKLMFWKDNHDRKMTEVDRKPRNKKKFPDAGKNATHQDVSTEKYRSFINTSKEDRNSNVHMKGAVKATVNQIYTKKDIVNGAKNWRAVKVKKGKAPRNRYF